VLSGTIAGISLIIIPTPQKIHPCPPDSQLKPEVTYDFARRLSPEGLFLPPPFGDFEHVARACFINRFGLKSVTYV